jgi:hypothetical protein
MVNRYMALHDTPTILAHLSDADLLTATAQLAERERHTTADLIAALMEIDARKLYLREGRSSLFTYCTQVLHFSEHAAYGRIEAARAARRFPIILFALASGDLTLTSVTLLGPVLTEDNQASLLAAARYRSKREVEHLVADVRPQPAVASTLRKLPAPRRIEPAAPIALSSETCGGDPAHCSSRSAAELQEHTATDPISATRSGPSVTPARNTLTPLAPEHYKLQVTISREAHDHLRRAQDLLRHTIPNGDPALVVARALAVLVADLEKNKCAAVKRPRAHAAEQSVTRHVPAAVKRAVFARDEGRCAFVGAQGRCQERGFLEFHHVVPFAEGGVTDAENLQLRCRAHNAYEAERWFGEFIREASVAYGAFDR